MNIIKIKDESVFTALISTLSGIKELPAEFIPGEDELGTMIFTTCNPLTDYYNELTEEWNTERNTSIKYDRAFALAYGDAVVAIMDVEFDHDKAPKIKKFQVTYSKLQFDENNDETRLLTLFNTNDHINILPFLPINELFIRLNEHHYDYDNLAITDDYHYINNKLNNCTSKGVYFSKGKIHVYIYETYIKETGEYNIKMLSKGIMLNAYHNFINKVKEIISFKITDIHEQTLLNLFNVNLNNVRYINIHYNFFPPRLVNVLISDGNVSGHNDENKNIILNYSAKDNNENIEIILHMLRDKTFIITNNIFQLRSKVSQVFKDIYDCVSEPISLKTIEKIFNMS